MAMQCRLQWRTTAFVRRGRVAPREVAYVRRGRVSPRGEGVCVPGDVCHPEDEATSGGRRDGVVHRQRGALCGAAAAAPASQHRSARSSAKRRSMVSWWPRRRRRIELQVAEHHVKIRGRLLAIILTVCVS